MLNYVEKIINYGFLGLAFLMLFLVYDLIKKAIIKEESPDEKVEALIKNFTRTSLLFIVLAGPLHWATIGLKDWIEKDRVTIFVGINQKEWDKSIGNLNMLSDKQEYVSINAKPISKVFEDGDHLLIDVSQLVDSIKEMRFQIQQLIINSSGSKEIKNTIEEG